jgi:hypothetical protein
LRTSLISASVQILSADSTFLPSLRRTFPGDDRGQDIPTM